MGLEGQDVLKLLHLPLVARCLGPAPGPSPGRPPLRRGQRSVEADAQRGEVEARRVHCTAGRLEAAEAPALEPLPLATGQRRGAVGRRRRRHRRRHLLLQRALPHLRAVLRTMRGPLEDSFGPKAVKSLTRRPLLPNPHQLQKGPKRKAPRAIRRWRGPCGQHLTRARGSDLGVFEVPDSSSSMDRATACHRH